MTDNAEHAPRFVVVRNHEEQYSLWPAGRSLPSGWSAEGTEGSRDDCLARIKQVWTDMRPKSLRDRPGVLPPGISDSAQAAGW